MPYIMLFLLIFLPHLSSVDEESIFLRDDIISLVSIPDIEFPSFHVISFEFENITSNYLYFEFELVNYRDIIEMAN